MKPFANEPVLELRRAANRDALLGALAELDARLPLQVPAIIGGGNKGPGHLLPADRSGTFESTDPGAPDRVVAIAARAS